MLHPLYRIVCASLKRLRLTTWFGPFRTPAAAIPGLVKLRDGRLVVTFGYRAEPFGIRARISRDEGRTWGDDLVLRSGAVDWDLGYTRSVQRPDGQIVTVYYYNDDTAPERYIASTIWTP